ncbi:hypothetical protein [Luteipulveratus mongoliensis]|uniref:Uncharacterized protein n=1 Tax=Luteipulveratus mongoliensis TaxID=571913 RepID=A0A0K1JGC4_9MICO|nr:hypothetical protein [Luteipulveratus mongoliensis]AKU15749.1 hypothetical protein VV02_07610 [Luteipulveratus mongoliensis]
MVRARAKVRVVVHDQVLRDIEQSDEADRMIRNKAEAVAAACNAESSWGGYEVADDSEEPIPARAVVIDIAEPSTDTRADRMIRNLAAGRDA